MRSSGGTRAWASSATATSKPASGSYRHGSRSRRTTRRRHGRTWGDCGSACPTGSSRASLPSGTNSSRRRSCLPKDGPTRLRRCCPPRRDERISRAPARTVWSSWRGRTWRPTNRADACNWWHRCSGENRSTTGRPSMPGCSPHSHTTGCMGMAKPRLPWHMPSSWPRPKESCGRSSWPVAESEHCWNDTTASTTPTASSSRC